MAAKYVVGLLEDKYGAIRAFALLFPDVMQHSEIGLQVFGSKDKMVAAGDFTLLDDGEVSVSGKSISLGLGNRGLPDEWLIRTSLGLQSLQFNRDDRPEGSAPGSILREIESRIKNYGRG